VMTVWRLVTARFTQTAFSGDGAKRYGGRWNRKGVPMVYTSGSQALAMLEMVVQDDSLRARYMVIPAEIPPRVAIERLFLDDLPPRIGATSRPANRCRRSGRPGLGSCGAR